MKLSIHEKDIGSQVCQRCAACCRIKLSLPKTDPRYRKFLRGVGLTILPPPTEEGDCCDKIHDVSVDLGNCLHLEISDQEGHPFYKCRIHGTEDFPELCEQYNCVGWAKARNGYNEDNEMLRQAQAAFDSLRG